MNNCKNHITIFEHQSLKVGQRYKSHKKCKSEDDVEFKDKHRQYFERFYGDKGVPFFKLIHKGVRFNKYVGVIQLGNLTVEVLPKADKIISKNDEKDVWRDILIGMLGAVNAFKIHAPSSSSLSLRSNSILDLYFEIFIKEIEYLFNKGLIKKYRKAEGNILSLKGNLLFSKHIQKNLVHQERFYVKHSNYDNKHLIHQLLYKTIYLLKRINNNVALNSRIGNLLLNFPEMKDIKVTESLFNKISLNRKTEEYKNALEISKLLLLNYHPDLSNGQNHVLALMFDMNLLWEEFVYVSLRNKLNNIISISAQTTKNFWQPTEGSDSNMRPDIVITMDGENTIVLDTKGKNIGDSNPSSNDLRQMYVYHHYFNANKVALVYPGEEVDIAGAFYTPGQEVDRTKICSILKVPTKNTISIWQDNIANQIKKWIENE